jgi:NAD(P) transhydrogenase subunit alpha
MNIAVLRETQPGEARVALVPESVKKLVAVKAGVTVESGAGAQAGASDDDYRNAGAEVSDGRDSLLSSADVLAAVNRPAEEDMRRLKRDAVLVGFLRPLDEPASLRPLAELHVTSFAMELVPRITRAQAMDALSSMATVAGYKAVLTAAERLPRMFPLLMTAAGTVPPARVLVLGAGVAGLQAIATARRLGAVVTAFDVRAAVREQVESLGARFLELDLGDAEGEGGYAKELAEDQAKRQQEAMAEAIGRFDVVITTAQVPGRRAPLLVTAQAVENMKPGSVIVDMAGDSGGNCELTEPGETVVKHDVTIASPLNLPGDMPDHASQLYSRNVSALLELMVKDGELTLDFDDAVIAGACITRDGEIVHEGAKQAVGAATS